MDRAVPLPESSREHRNGVAVAARERGPAGARTLADLSAGARSAKVEALAKAGMESFGIGSPLRPKNLRRRDNVRGNDFHAGRHDEIRVTALPIPPPAH